MAVCLLTEGNRCSLIYAISSTSFLISYLCRAITANLPGPYASLAKSDRDADVDPVFHEVGLQQLIRPI